MGTQNNSSYTQTRAVNSDQYDIKIDFNATKTTISSAAIRMPSSTTQRSIHLPCGHRLLGCAD